jgi:uncharacterized protein YcaQ
VTVTDNGQGARVAPVPPVPLRMHIDAVRVAVGRVEALVAVLADWLDGVSWHNAGPLEVERMIYVIDMVQEKAAAAIAVVDRFDTLVADRQRAEPGEPGDSWW